MGHTETLNTPDTRARDRAKAWAQKIYGSEPTTMEGMIQSIQSVVRHNLQDRGIELWGLSCDLAGRVQDPYKTSHLDPSNGPIWYGRVWARYSGFPANFGSDAFVGSLSEPGTGGAGGYGGPWKKSQSLWFTHICQPRRAGRHAVPDHPEPVLFSWDFLIRCALWPEVYRSYLNEVSEQDVADRLRGVASTPRPNFKYEYNHPDAVKEDKDLAAYCYRLSLPI